MKKEENRIIMEDIHTKMANARKAAMEYDAIDIDKENN